MALMKYPIEKRIEALARIRRGERVKVVAIDLEIPWITLYRWKDEELKFGAVREELIALWKGGERDIPNLAKRLKITKQRIRYLIRAYELKEKQCPSAT